MYIGMSWQLLRCRRENFPQPIENKLIPQLLIDMFPRDTRRHAASGEGAPDGVGGSGRPGGLPPRPGIVNIVDGFVQP